MTVRATPFHSRAAAHNLDNAWETRAGWTLSSYYADAEEEALAPRATAAFADISWRWRVAIDGARAEEFLARLLTKNPARLAPGSAFKALWLSDGGGVRGACVLARHGRESFQLIAAGADRDWIARGAALFEVSVREIGAREGGLAIVGPYAAKIVAEAGLDPALETLAFKKLFWRGLDVTVSRFGEHGGFEVWCQEEDASLLWDRIAEAGRNFALKPVGMSAMDVADLEAGVPRPGRDYEPARDGFAAAPTPHELGLETLIEDDHALFNGRAAFLGQPRAKTRVGVEFDDGTPRPRAPLTRNGQVVGHTMSSLHSPALRRAIALAIVDNAVAAPGIELSDGARVVALPFLPTPDPIAE